MESIRTCISFQASAAAKVIARLSRAQLAPFGITPIQFAVLQGVHETPRCTAAELGTHLMIDSATIVGVIDRLASMDLLARAPDQKDRRINRLNVTAKGAQILPDLQASMDDLNARVDAELNGHAADVRRTLIRLIDLHTLTKD